MEDTLRPHQVESPDEALTKKKKRRYFFGNDFESSWLAYKDADAEELAEKASDNPEEEEGKETSKKRRWLKKFRNFFKRDVKLEAVSSGTADEKETAGQEESVSFWTLLQSQTEKPPTTETQTSEVTGEREATKRADGELIIRHDDEEPSTEDVLPEPVEVAAPDYMDYFQATDELGAYQSETDQMVDDRKAEVPTAAIGGDTPSDTKQLEQTMDWNERYHKRQERRLKKKTRDLKSQDRRLKREHERLEQRQEDTERTLRNMQPNPFTEKLRGTPDVPLTSLEYEVVKQKNNSREVKTPTPDTPANSVERVPHEDQEVTSRQYTPEQTAEIQSTQAIRERVEKAADQNLPIEKIYEHRHEVKDEATRQGAHVSVPAVAGNEIAAAYQRQVESTSAGWQRSPSSSPPQPPISQDMELYRRAVRDGFITAVVILAIILVIGLVR